MIRATTAQVAIDLAKEFDERGLMLEAQTGTPLAQLIDTVKLSQVVLGETTQVSAPNEYAPDANHITALTSGWDGHLRGEEVLHNNTLDELATTISKQVQQHLKFAKTVVKPIVIELAEQFKNDIATISIDPYAGIQIKEYQLPKLLQEPGFVEDLDKFKNATLIPELKCMPFPQKTAQEIVELISAGTGYEETIKEWAATKGEVWLEQAWTAIFTNEPAEFDFQSIKKHDDAMDYYLLTYLACAKLHDNPPEGIALSLGNYNVMLLEFKSNAAFYLLFNANTYSDHVKTGLLIKNYSAKEILVVSEVYKQWLEKGGNNGLLLAAVLMDKPIVFMGLMEANKEQLERRWQRHVAMVNTTEANKRFVKYREILKDRTQTVVRNNFQQCYAHLSETGEATDTQPEYQMFKQRLEEYVQKVKDKDFENVWNLALEVVCQCVFFYTDAEKILRGIEEACCKNPELQANEAAYLSMISYVTDYVCDQIQIKAL